ncbi:dihydrodipicolinate synthase family protein [Herbiconiux sp. KACC 21604]|uniref:dihydrodipicolinate synthase family protein n=1 Tax=unclassified Herbiconiux TaxID=2618217 RepID=UPI0014924C97|nr:dihydrodipicolinate synthase family protein [Herbiconiux sp. SALV-R1]QJU55124.1 dihydrodipicolinate synthase family protein [Herbiconiux sp. SALV-R1]WPO86274.1 dihydrodipicolinate synthase family protein [Herbiconiux sp. KACC 21604]
MDRNTVDWKGYWPAAPTAFTEEGSFDDQVMREIIELYVQAGVHGVLINGSAGEWWAQTDEERTNTARVAVEAAAGRIPVIVGCTSFTADQVLRLADGAAEAGASGVLTTPPPYAHPTQQEVLQFYRDVDAQVQLPLVAYNWPRGAALEIELDTARHIADLEHVVAIKNSTADWVRVVDFIEALAGQVRIFSSLINRRGLAIMRELGGDGYIDGGGIGAPFAVPFFENLWAGDLDAARPWADKWWALTSSFIAPDFGGRFGSPSSQLKSAMAILGQPVSHVRPPLQPVTDPVLRQAIADRLRDAGLID